MIEKKVDVEIDKRKKRKREKERRGIKKEYGSTEKERNRTCSELTAETDWTLTG